MTDIHKSGWHTVVPDLFILWVSYLEKTVVMIHCWEFDLLFCSWLGCAQKPSDSTDIASPKTSKNRGSAPHEDTHMNGQLSAAKAVSGKATTNGFISSEWGNPSRNTEIEKPSKENESTKEPSPLQYVYVQSPAGKRYHAFESFAVLRLYSACLHFSVHLVTTLMS